MREHKVAHEEQERRKCNRASKVERLDHVLSSTFLPYDEETEDGNPRDQQDYPKYLALLYWIRVVHGMPGDQYGSDDDASDCTGS
jgi:hypothetical protein